MAGMLVWTSGCAGECDRLSLGGSEGRGGIVVRGLYAHGLASEGRRVLILSPDPDLAGKSPLPLRKIIWSPYPEWVVRHFNFNDWTRFAVRSKNVYELLPQQNR